MEHVPIHVNYRDHKGRGLDVNVVSCDSAR